MWSGMQSETLRCCYCCWGIRGVSCSDGFLLLPARPYCKVKLDVRGSVPRSTIHEKKKIQQDARLYQNGIIPYLYEAQHVSGDTPLIIRSLKLH